MKNKYEAPELERLVFYFISVFLGALVLSALGTKMLIESNYKIRKDLQGMVQLSIISLIVEMFIFMVISHDLFDVFTAFQAFLVIMGIAMSVCLFGKAEYE